jgi:type I restriction enzyme M protein
MSLRSRKTFAPAKLYGQENEPGTWAMANMNMIIHDMEGEIQIGDTFRKPKFRQGNRLQTFDRVVANPMWNQNEFKEKDYDADELDRFPKGAGYPGNKADWGWMQHVLTSMNSKGRAAVVLDTGAASRGSGNANTNKENEVVAGSSSRISSRVSSISRKIFFTTPRLQASLSFSIRQSRKSDKASFF